MWLLLACTDPVPTPARDYAEVAVLALEDPAAAADACTELDPGMVDECLSFTARAAEPKLGAEICGRTAPGAWQDECWFSVAENRAVAGKGIAAARTCAKAGRFTENCIDHIWRAHAGQLLADSTPAEAAAAYVEARAWSDEAMPKLARLDARFWLMFYDAPLHDDALPRLDSGWCAQMSGELGDACRSTMPVALRHTLTRLQREAVARDALPLDKYCGDAPLGDRIAADLELRWVSSPVLDGAAAQVVAEVCGG